MIVKSEKNFDIDWKLLKESKEYENTVFTLISIGVLIRQFQLLKGCLLYIEPFQSRVGTLCSNVQKASEI